MLNRSASSFKNKRGKKYILSFVGGVANVLPTL